MYFKDLFCDKSRVLHDVNVARFLNCSRVAVLSAQVKSGKVLNTVYTGIQHVGALLIYPPLQISSISVADGNLKIKSKLKFFSLNSCALCVKNLPQQKKI